MSSHALSRRSRRQLAALVGSIGQGPLRCCQLIIELIAKITPAAINNDPLCAESHMRPGIAEVRLAITAPAPSEISSAGSAQHNKVDVLPNKARLGSNVSRQSPVTKRFPRPPRRVGSRQSDSRPARLSWQFQRRLMCCWAIRRG